MANPIICRPILPSGVPSEPFGQQIDTYQYGFVDADGKPVDRYGQIVATGRTGGWRAGKTASAIEDGKHSLIHNGPGKGLALIGPTEALVWENLLDPFLRAFPCHPDHPNQSSRDKIKVNQWSPAIASVNYSQRKVSLKPEYGGGFFVWHTFGQGGREKTAAGAGQGWGVSAMIITEAQNLSKGQLTRYISRVSEPARYMRVILEGLAEEGTPFMDDWCRNGQTDIDRPVFEYLPDPIPPGYFRVQWFALKTRENPHIAAGVLDMFSAGMSEGQRAMYEEGLPTSKQNAVYKELSRKPWPEGNVIKWEHDKSLPTYGSLDPGLLRASLGFWQQPPIDAITTDIETRKLYKGKHVSIRYHEALLYDKTTDFLGHHVVNWGLSMFAAGSHVEWIRLAHDPHGNGREIVSGSRPVQAMIAICKGKKAKTRFGPLWPRLSAVRRIPAWSRGAGSIDAGIECVQVLILDADGCRRLLFAEDLINTKPHDLLVNGWQAMRGYEYKNGKPFDDDLHTHTCDEVRAFCSQIALPNFRGEVEHRRVREEDRPQQSYVLPSLGQW